jgi:hypothetical protein
MTCLFKFGHLWQFQETPSKIYPHIVHEEISNGENPDKCYEAIVTDGDYDMIEGKCHLLKFQVDYPNGPKTITHFPIWSLMFGVFLTQPILIQISFKDSKSILVIFKSSLYQLTPGF